MAKKKKQHYVVIRGRRPGLYERWFGEGGAAEQVDGLADAVFRGFYTLQEAAEWLRTLAPEALAQVEIFACGPTPMLKACADVARQFGLPCQVSLEEFMACAVGGCAGCTVLVQTPQGPAMKRVCVDGPVFDAEAVFPVAA